MVGAPPPAGEPASRLTDPVELSVVIPARDAAAVLPDQLDALSAQRWEGCWEVVVAVEAGPDDGTADVVGRYAEAWPRLRVVDAPAGGGPGSSRNVGSAAAAGSALAFCDADDVVAPGWVAAMGEALRQHEFVTGPLELDRLNPEWLAATRGRSEERGLPTFYGVFPFAHGNNLGLRRAVWERLGRFDEDFPNGADDIEFGMRAWRGGVAVQFVPDAVVHYRYRRRPGDLWRQGLTYGRSRPLVRRRLKELGAPAPSAVAGWRSWLWLVRHVPRLASPEGRAAWLWVAGNRVGQVQGSLRHRCLLV
jgi:glycosyltransferase involved in cell wall biosynthesis